MAEGVAIGVAVGVIMVLFNMVVSYVRGRRSKDKKAIQLLLKCTLVQLCALKKAGIVNGDCNEVLEELNEFLIEK